MLTGAFGTAEGGRRRVELHQLEPTVAVRGPYHRQVAVDALECDEAVHLALDRRLSLELQAEVEEERDDRFHVFDYRRCLSSRWIVMAFSPGRTALMAARAPGTEPVPTFSTRNHALNSVSVGTFPVGRAYRGNDERGPTWGDRLGDRGRRAAGGRRAGRPADRGSAAGSGSPGGCVRPGRPTSCSTRRSGTRAWACSCPDTGQPCREEKVPAGLSGHGRCAPRSPLGEWRFAAPAGRNSAKAVVAARGTRWAHRPMGTTGHPAPGISLPM